MRRVGPRRDGEAGPPPDRTLHASLPANSAVLAERVLRQRSRRVVGVPRPSRDGGVVLAVLAGVTAGGPAGLEHSLPPPPPAGGPPPPPGAGVGDGRGTGAGGGEDHGGGGRRGGA